MSTKRMVKTSVAKTGKHTRCVVGREFTRSVDVRRARDTRQLYLSARSDIDPSIPKQFTFLGADWAQKDLLMSGSGLRLPNNRPCHFVRQLFLFAERPNRARSFWGILVSE